jgi:DNA-binding transcriptional MerR regulator
VRTQEVVARAGVSYRQINSWVEQGWLVPDQHGGSGYLRDWSHAEARVAAEMGELVRAGMKPDAAADLARSLQATSSVALSDAFVLARKATP